MSIEILMPALSPTMTEGNLTKWLVTEGQQVKAGDVIAEIETDKVVLEVVAPFDGVISKIHKPAGEIVQSAELIAEFEKVWKWTRKVSSKSDRKKALQADVIVTTSGM